jgi:hypothetical protein
MQQSKLPGDQHLVWYCGRCAADRPQTRSSECGTCGAPMIVRDSRRETVEDAHKRWKDIVGKRS